MKKKNKEIKKYIKFSIDELKVECIYYFDVIPDENTLYSISIDGEIITYEPDEFVDNIKETLEKHG